MIQHSKPKQSLSPWGKAVAGAVAASMANALVYPLDLAKTRLQVQNGEYNSVLDVLQKVYQKGGLPALYKGIFGNLAGTVSTNFVYFYWYSLLRGKYKKRYSPHKELNTPMELLLGAMAGTVAQLFTIPVSVVTIRQQTHDMSFIEAGKDVLKHDGPSGLWRGLKASLILVVNPSITYGSSARLRSLIYGDKKYLTVVENFMLGAMSKSLATFATQPLIVAKVVQQSSSKVKSFVDVLIKLIKTGGVRALFRGILPQLSKGVLVQGLLLAFKDKVERYILLLMLSIRYHRIQI